MLHVTAAEHLGQYRIRLAFNDGTSGVADLAGRLDGPVFHPLQDPEVFRRFRLVGHTVAWENGADLAPEYLHALVHGCVEKGHSGAAQSAVAPSAVKPVSE